MVTNVIPGNASTKQDVNMGWHAQLPRPRVASVSSIHCGCGLVGFMEQKELVDWFGSLQPLLDKELIDRWALGIVLYSMLIGSGPFRSQGRNSNLLYRDIKEKEVTFPPEKVFKIFCPPTICLLVLGADQRISRGCARVFDKGRKTFWN